MNASPASAPDAEAPERLDASVLKVAGVVVLGSIMAVLDITVVNIAMPTFQKVFQVANYSTVVWTVTAYTLALAAVIPLTGWAAERFGTKRLYMVALLLFTGGSVLCGQADSIGALIAFRAVQGLGGGMLMPLGMTIMTKAAGPERMGRLMSVLGIPMLLGPILGPILGGWIIGDDGTNWEWIFLINLPIGLIALVYAWFALPKDEGRPTEKFDFVGMLMLSPGLALLLYGVSTIPEEGTMNTPKVWATMLVGAALVAAFVVYSFTPKNPLLDLRLFRNRDLTVATATMFLFSASFFGGLLLIPTYFQQVRGESPLMAGVLLAPQGIGSMLTMPIAGILVDKIPVGRVVPVGLVILTATMFGLTQIGADTPYLYVLGVLFVMGLGMGLTMMPLMTAALRTLKETQVSRGSTLLNIIQQIASSVGVAVISVVLTNRMQNSEVVQAGQSLLEAQEKGLPPDPSAVQFAAGMGADFEQTVRTEMAGAYATSFWVGLALCAVTVVFSLLLSRKASAVAPGEKTTPPVMMH